jgi:hypothetical protein
MQSLTFGGVGYVYAMYAAIYTFNRGKYQALLVLWINVNRSKRCFTHTSGCELKHPMKYVPTGTSDLKVHFQAKQAVL